jgi:cytochrome c556
MRRFVTCVTALTIAWLGTLALAQSKIATVEDYSKIMKSNAQTNGAMNKAIASGAYADARMNLATLRGNFTTLHAFWTERKRDDAVGILKDALSKMDTLDKQLSATTVDQTAAQATAKEIQGACGGCHKAYREGDAQAGFRFRPGVF